VSLTHDEREALLAIKRDVHDIRDDLALLRTEVLQHGIDIRDHAKQLMAHDFRIGTLESAVGRRGNPMVDPKRARYEALSVPPKTAADLGLQATDSGTTWKTKDAAAVVRRFEDLEQQKIGAEMALERERKNFDRRLKNIGAIAGLVVLLVASAVGAVTYLATHVQVVAPEHDRR
jgi:hypothetical protein